MSFLIPILAPAIPWLADEIQQLWTPEQPTADTLTEQDGNQDYTDVTDSEDYTS